MTTEAQITAVDADVWGRHPVRFVKVTLDSSYPTGGESFDLRTYRPATAASADPIFVSAQLESGSALGYIVGYDPTNRKIVVFRQINPANAGGADIPFTEVTAATDLSTLVVRFLAIWA